MDALMLLGVMCLVAIVCCWLVSVITGNCSQVDRMWSILPIVYVGTLAGLAGFRDARLDLMAALVMLWGGRLTYNFVRKGGYRPGSEDYRWPVLRQRLGAGWFPLFNLVFIAGFQNVQLVLLAGPAYVVFNHRVALGPLDVAAAVAHLCFVAGETVADRQQWEFHRRKQEAQARGQAVEPPFLTDGLFRYSRHPNFFCEQALWWCVYLFSVAASGQVVNCGIIGPAVLVLLFQGSTSFTEEITLSKYPSYAAYQRTTSRLWPLPPSWGWI